jgi:hypothetical protein
MLLDESAQPASIRKISELESTFSGTLSAQVRANLGVSVDGIGDFNNDGYVDMVVGASRGTTNGAVYIMQLQTDSIIRNEVCDPQSRCEYDAYYVDECTTDSDCVFVDQVNNQSVDLGACIVKPYKTCTDLCELNVCGDGIMNPGNDNDPTTNDADGSQTEQCDSGIFDNNECYGS